MSRRFNLPYTTQDLFPQAATGTPSSSRLSGRGSVGGRSVVSSGSAFSNQVGNDPPDTIRFSNFKLMLKRLFKPTTLDFETAIWEIFNLIINPKKMYRSHYYYKQQQLGGKSTYARDDPSFLILLTAFLSISGVAWGLAYSPHIWDIFKLVIYMVFIDFYLTGIIIATVFWFVTNKLVNNSQGGFISFSRYSVNYIEWGFCFDIHCNSFLIIWCLLYVVQFLLLPIILKKTIISLILGNTLYFGTIARYFVITFYGFSSLPFINQGLVNSSNENSGYSLQLIIIVGILPLLAIAWNLCIIFRFNIASTMFDTYFN